MEQQGSNSDTDIQLPPWLPGERDEVGLVEFPGVPSEQLEADQLPRQPTAVSTRRRSTPPLPVSRPAQAERSTPATPSVLPRSAPQPSPPLAEASAGAKAEPVLTPESTAAAQPGIIPQLAAEPAPRPAAPVRAPVRHPLSENRVTFTAGTAFKAGFFGLFGVVSAAFLIAIAAGLCFSLLFIVFWVAN